MLFWPNKTCWDVNVASGNCEKMCKNLSSVIVNLIIGTDWTIEDIISTKCQPEESNLTRRTYFVTIFEPQMSNFLLFAAISPCTFDARLPRLIIKVWPRALSWALEGLGKSWRALFTHLWHFIHENNRSIHEYNLQPQPCSPPPPPPVRSVSIPQRMRVALPTPPWTYIFSANKTLTKQKRTAIKNRISPMNTPKP